jgi:hypothetical protein
MVVVVVLLGKDGDLAIASFPIPGVDDESGGDAVGVTSNEVVDAVRGPEAAVVTADGAPNGGTVVLGVGLVVIVLGSVVFGPVVKWFM